jgi:WXXGXW repeat (2 copies)
VTTKVLSAMRFFLMAILLVAISASLGAQVLISVGFAPPPLPVYTQPPCPASGYLWTPGYWAYGPYGYYWVPGTWVLAPVNGYLWTPGYWGWGNNAYLWHAGYWGPQVGYYGGIDYGYGYPGNGYYGGYWQNRAFYYNRVVNNVNVVNVHNVYSRTVVNNVNVTRVSYNGGQGGVTARPTAAQEAAARERHVASTSAQRQHELAARGEPTLRATENHGRPPIAATPAAFRGQGLTAAHNAPVHTTATERSNARPKGTTERGNAARPTEANAPRPETPTAKASRPETRAPAPERENSTRSAAAPRPEAQPRPSDSRAAEARKEPRPPAQSNESERTSVRGEQPHEAAPAREATRSAAGETPRTSARAEPPHEASHPAATETPRPPARSEAPPPREASRPAPAETTRPSANAEQPHETAPPPREASHPAAAEAPRPEARASEAPRTESHPEARPATPASASHENTHPDERR